MDDDPPDHPIRPKPRYAAERDALLAHLAAARHLAENSLPGSISRSGYVLARCPDLLGLAPPCFLT
jgi:hypothetical protein